MIKAIILAGGFGTRLRSVVQEVPKPMAPIHGKPFLGYLLEDIWSQGVIEEVIFSVYYKHEIISGYFGDFYKTLPLKYVVESFALGTGGAIGNCAHLLNDNDHFFIFNGDSFLQLSHLEMYREHLQSKGPMTLALKKMSNCGRYGRVEMNSQNQVCSFLSSGDVSEGYINAGVYLCHPKVFMDFPKAPFSLEADFLQKKVDDLKPNTYCSSGYFIDIGIPEDYLRAIQEFK